jgi:hypothetical protein
MGFRDENFLNEGLQGFAGSARRRRFNLLSRQL